MRKIFIITLVLMMALCASTFATETRTLVMGDNDRVLVDDVNAFRFPGRTYSYPNLAVGEFNGNGFHNFGINWQMGNDNPWVMGTYFSTLGAVSPTFFDGTNMLSGGPLGVDNRRITFLYGRQLGDNNLGLAFDYIRGGTETDDSTDVSEASFGFYQFTFGLTEGSTGAWDIALVANFGSWTDKDFNGDDLGKPDGYSDFGVEGRYFMVKGPKVTMVPHIGLMVGKRGMDDFGADLTVDTDDVNIKQSAFEFDLGMGMNYTSGPDLLAVVDYGIIYSKAKTEFDMAAASSETEIKTYAIPYFKIGFEADVFKWMDIRMGATSFWHSTESKNDDPLIFDVKTKGAINETFLGFGFHWGRLHVDAETNPQLFLDGFNFLSGRANDMNFQFSALYEMF